MSTINMHNDISELPNICGSEASIAEALEGAGHVFPPQRPADIERIQSAFAIALHMHQPLIPAGSDDRHTASIISNLAHMMHDLDSGAR
ncbi:MAG: hypothetical protein NTU53_19030, partial [Planctomycetota bacterium]|nr:hypothetical protein [Planctomycetota bacterium]